MAMLKCTNLTQMLVTMTSKAQMLAHLNDRERSVRSKLRKGLEKDVPSADLQPLTDELQLITAVREEL